MTPHRLPSAPRIAVVTAALTLIVAGSLWAHDLFLRLDSYFVAPAADVQIRVLNGTFSTSEAPVARERLRSLDLGDPEQHVKLDTAAWQPHGDTTMLALRTGPAGTYVVGASLLPRSIALAAKDFNGYLASDGVPDILAERRRQGMLARPAKELYEKHVKAVFQVGEARSSGFDRVFGYPAELVPLDNPYSVRPGGSLRFRALVDGEPVPNQFVLVGGRTPAGARIAQRGLRTGADGVVRVPRLQAGTWYVKFIHMIPTEAGDTVGYHSKWATLTFAVRR